MKRTAIFGLIFGLAVAALLATADDKKANVLLQGAMAKETVQGDLKGAIALYQSAVKEAGANRTLAAKALVHMAECYQKLGDAESNRIYEQIIHEYADQKEAVATARTRLGADATTTSAGTFTRRVWTMANASGTPIAADFYGQVSPDGRYVPYTNWDENGDLFAHDLVTGMERRLTNTADDRPGGTGGFAEEAAFSRDSKQLAYTWDTKEGVELRVIGLQGESVPQPRRLIVNRELKWISPYSWSPDGKSIAVRIQRQDRSGQLGLVSLEDGSLRVLKSVDWEGSSGVFFSPDGKYLAYDVSADESTRQQDIFVLAVDGSREIPVVVHPSQDTVVGWSSDGKRLLFASDRSGSMSLWALPFGDGKPQGQPELLKSDIGELQMTGTGASGAGILGVTVTGSLFSAVYNPGVDPADIQFGAFDSTSGKFLSTPASAARAFLGSNMLPVWSPDGKYLAYASMRKTHVAIGIRSMEAGQIREVVPSPNFTPSPGYFGSLTWAPDGSSFIVAARGDKDGNGVYRIDAQSGHVSLLAMASRTRWAVESPDGKTLYYHVGTDEGMRILARDLMSGEDRELIRGKSMGLPSLSRDGRYVGTITSNAPSGGPSTLVVARVAGGPSRELISRPTLGAVNFSPDGRYMATRSTDPATKSNAILLVPTEGGEARELMAAPASQVLVVAAWSPDNRSILIKKSSPKWDQSELWRVPIEGGSSQKLDLNVDRIQGALLASPDGRHVAFQTPQSERKPTEIWVTENLLRALKPSK